MSHPKSSCSWLFRLLSSAWRAQFWCSMYISLRWRFCPEWDSWNRVHLSGQVEHRHPTLHRYSIRLCFVIHKRCFKLLLMIPLSLIVYHVKLSASLCFLPAKRCPILNPPSHGSLVCADPHEKFSFGSQCNITCMEGFVLNGTTTTECNALGMWSLKIPHCLGNAVLDVMKITVRALSHETILLASSFTCLSFS